MTVSRRMSRDFNSRPQVRSIDSLHSFKNQRPAFLPGALLCGIELRASLAVDREQKNERSEDDGRGDHARESPACFQ